MSFYKRIPGIAFQGTILILLNVKLWHVNMRTASEHVVGLDDCISRLRFFASRLQRALAFLCLSSRTFYSQLLWLCLPFQFCLQCISDRHLHGVDGWCMRGQPVYVLAWIVILICMAYYDPAHIIVNQPEPYMHPNYLLQHLPISTPKKRYTWSN